MASENPTKAGEARALTEAMRDLLLGIRARFEEEIRSGEVTLAQFRLLKAVEAQVDASAASIARECGVTPQTLQAMLVRAEREGWIARGTSERNHRYVTAALTAAGKKVLAEGRAVQARLEAELWRGVSASALRNARRTLEAGLENLLQHQKASPAARTHPRR